jgi:hypothetical protein
MIICIKEKAAKRGISTNSIYFYSFSFFRIRHTDKKEQKIFLIFKETQKGAVAKSYMTNGLLILYIY